MKKCKKCNKKMIKMAYNGYAVWMCSNEMFIHPIVYPTQQELDKWFATHKLWRE